jgi:hypothetical protein
VSQRDPTVTSPLKNHPGGYHAVWIQFHEDLLATLGIPRGSD